MPERIRLLILDVDGVLTDGSISLDAHGGETKTFHVRDGLGLNLWRQAGFETAIVTGRSSPALRHRARELGITHLMQGVRDKRKVFHTLLHDLELEASQVAVIGDDLPDLPMLRFAGYPIAVADAASEVREVARFTTIRPGGRGAVREAIEHLLVAMDLWDAALDPFRVD